MTFSKLGTDIDTQQMVYLPKASRTKGVYILGLQGAGKSGLIENLCTEDGKQGTGFCVIDPHGELIDNVISRLPAHREQDVILFDIRDYQYPFGLNLFSCSDPTNPLAVQEVVDQVMHVFEMLVDVNPNTPQILDYLRNCTNVLVANPGYTMADVTLLLKNRTCREKLLQNVSDSSVLSFWHDYFDQMSLKEQLSESISLERRVRHFLQALTLNIVGQSKTSIDFRFVMDEGKILLVKLDSLRLPSVTKLIGALIIALFLNAAPSRTKKNLFNIYADEFPLYATEDFVTLIEQARKRQIGLAMAHQNRGQLDARTSNVANKLRDRTLGTKQKIIFTITGQDADEVAGEFDVSPQAAWEEEIEKESVEVLKPEWYERVEEEVVDGEEEIKTPVKDVVHHLLNGGSHSNPVVNQFAHEILPKMQTVKDYHNRPLDALNRLLYKAMTGTQTTREDIQTFIHDLCWACKIYAFSFHLHDSIVSLSSPVPLQNTRLNIFTPEVINAFHTFWETGNSIPFYQVMEQRIRTDIFEDLTGELYHWETTLEFWHIQVKSNRGNLAGCVPIVEILTDPSIGVDITAPPKLSSGGHGYSHWTGLTTIPPWFSINILQLEWEQRTENHPATVVKNTYIPPTDWNSWKLQPNQEWKCYRQADFDAAVNQVYWEQRNKFDEVVTLLKQTIQALAAQPIEVGSGLVRPRKRKQINYHTHPAQTLTHPRKTIMHPQRPYQDVKNDIANQLSGLANFTARVRLDETFTQNPGKKCLSCKLLNNPGAKFCSKCGTKLPAPNEYTIETIKPTGYIGTQQLQQRIQGIQARNRQKLYCRSKKDVEAEITKRQQSCSGGSTPAQQQPQQPSPQQSRHARQVPVQGKCKNCGASNSPGAKFCNQCGTKLI